MRRCSFRLAAVCAVLALSAALGCSRLVGLNDGNGAGPAPAGNPGMDLTSGGNVSASPHYTLVGAVSETPGGNVVATSKSYTLAGGVVANGQ